MITLTKQVYYGSRSDVVRLYYLTDLHLGAKACDEQQLARDIKAIADDPNAYWIGGGDYVEAICQVGDKRYRPSVLAKWALGFDDVMGAQRDKAVEYLAPIAHKCLGLVKGNHENGAERFYARNLYWEIVLGIAKAANKPPESLAVGVNGFISIHFRRGSEAHYHDVWRMNIFVHHGYGGGRLPGGHALTLGRVLGDFDCDLALLGHRHVQAVITKMITRPGGKKSTAAVLQPRIGAFVPSYLRAFITPSSDKQPLDSYAEEFGLPPLPVGTTPVLITPDKHAFGIMTSSAPGLDLYDAPIRPAQLVAEVAV
jgi:hypothetical protein